MIPTYNFHEIKLFIIKKEKEVALISMNKVHTTNYTKYCATVIHE